MGQWICITCKVTRQTDRLDTLP